MHTLKPRNPYACSPLLKKGGTHQRSQSGQRQHARQAMLAELDELDWIDHYPPTQAAESIRDDDDDAPGSFSRYPNLTKAASQRPFALFSRA